VALGDNVSVNVAKGLRAIGDPVGTTEVEWVRAMGRRPQSISALAQGQRLLQWRSGRYNIQRVAVLFDVNHVFVKITHRYQC
jgi:hypothetical protein